MKISAKYFSIIGIILFIIVLLNVDLPRLWAILLTINPVYILFSFILLGISIIIRALKWKVLINQYNKEYTLWQAFKTYVLGVAFGSVTPARAGDLIKILDLKKSIGMDAKQGISISIYDKIVDVLVLFTIGVVCLIVIAYVFSNKVDLFWLILLLIGILLSAMFFMTKSSQRIFKFIIGAMKFIPESFREKINELYDTFFLVADKIWKEHALFMYLILTLASWAMMITIPYFYIKSISLDIPFLYVLLFIPVALCIEVLPISILGIGSRDATLILLFSLMGITKEQSISISLMALLFSNLPIIIIGFYIGWKNKYTINIGRLSEGMNKEADEKAG